MIKLSKCRKPSRDEAIKISPKQKSLKSLWNEFLTLTYSIVLNELINVALAVEYRCADLEERDASA